MDEILLVVLTAVWLDYSCSQLDVNTMNCYFLNPGYSGQILSGYNNDFCYIGTLDVPKKHDYI